MHGGGQMATEQKRERGKQMLEDAIRQKYPEAEIIWERKQHVRSLGGPFVQPSLEYVLIVSTASKKLSFDIGWPNLEFIGEESRQSPTLLKQLVTPIFQALSDCTEKKIGFHKE